MKRLLMAAALALGVGQFAHADDKKPNTLTKEEIAQGWILLFDGETTFGWKIEGDAKVTEGNLMLGGNGQTTATCTTLFGYGGLAFEANADDAKDANLTFNDYKNSPFIHVAPPPRTGWQRFRAQVCPVDISVWAAGSKGFGIRGNFTKPTTIAFHVPAGQKLIVRNIEFQPGGTYDPENSGGWPRGLTPIFNAKDLTGWKEIPGHKSKFSVTDKGELNIKDGNGDIQTEGEYDDFVLQLDIFSNGDHLNSGVFYRCRPGEFWSGYEAQIRNEWITDVKLKDGSTVSGSYTDKGDKVTVQACTNAGGNNWRPGKDVKTINKSDIEEVIHHRDQVVDIGTGGIYNRQPARKVVSNDREWYTMTVVAHGTHMATWVNGYQVADFTDTAPIGDNARKGAKVSKGPISLQGHDPTTDLNFKNFRIAELPKTEEKK
jgi:hypothetical protein